MKKILILFIHIFFWNNLSCMIVDINDVDLTDPAVFDRPIVIKNFAVQVRSLDGTTPVRVGCLQIGIDQGVCFHRMFKDRDDLGFELQEFVDKAFGAA